MDIRNNPSQRYSVRMAFNLDIDILEFTQIHRKHRSHILLKGKFDIFVETCACRPEGLIPQGDNRILNINPRHIGTFRKVLLDFLNGLTHASILTVDTLLFGNLLLMFNFSSIDCRTHYGHHQQEHHHCSYARHQV